MVMPTRRRETAKHAAEPRRLPIRVASETSIVRESATATSPCIRNQSIRVISHLQRFDFCVWRAIMKIVDFPTTKEEIAMRSIHLADLYVPKGPNLWLTAISAVYIFSVSLALFLIFSFMGGNEFAESMGGNAGLGFLLGGLAVSAVFAIIEKQKG
jgi:hypothetical protein